MFNTQILCKNGLDYEHNSECLKGLQMVMNQPGCIFDIGCWTGTVSFICAHFLKEKNINKKIYLFDTFDGHPNECRTDIDNNWNVDTSHYKNVNIANIINMFEILNFHNYEIIQGDVTNTILSVDDTPCFVSMDLNYYLSTKIALTHLRNKCKDYTLIWEDDYNNITGITKAYDECEDLQSLDVRQTRGNFFKYNY